MGQASEKHNQTAGGTAIKSVVVQWVPIMKSRVKWFRSFQYLDSDMNFRLVYKEHCTCL